METSDPNTQFILNYRENGKIKSAILTNADSSQRVKVFFDTAGTGDAVYYYDNGNKKSEGRFTTTARPVFGKIITIKAK